MADGSTVDEEDVAEATPHFEFDLSFQTKIAALTIRDGNFASRTNGLIDPSYFENEADGCIVRAVLGHFNKYRTVPSSSSLVTIIKDAIASRLIRKDMVEEVKGRLKTILTYDVSDKDFVVDQVSNFAKERAMEAALLKSVECLTKRDFAAIEKLMKAAQAVGATEAGERYNYWDRIKDRTEYRKKRAAGLITPDGITTGYADLDKYLYHKGWGRKELSVIMGAAKAGKSMSLGEFAKHASLAGFNVLYATLEVSADIIASRLDANVADTAIKALDDHIMAVDAKVEAAAKRAGILEIREFATGTLKPSGLRRLLDKYRAEGVLFDLIVVDYLDLMSPERPTDSVTENSKSIYVDVRGIAFDENAAVLSATQSNREGAKAMTQKATDVAEDFNKVRIADEFLTINFTEPERASGEARLHFAASRNGESGFSLRIRQDREKMKFLVKILGRE